jgi:hypothetical protein
MTRLRRPSGPFLFAVGVHVLAAIVLANVAFHYDFSSLRITREPAAPVEHLTYVTLGPAAGAAGGTGVSAPARAARPSRGLVAPSRVPTAVIAPAAPAGGTPGGVVGGTGVGGGVGPVTGIVPGDPDPRLATDPHAFYPAPKTHAQRVDSAVKATIYAFTDSVARARASAGREPTDWTFQKGGGKWGIDGSKIYLGKFSIPSAVLAALPIRVQGNPGESIADRLSVTRRADVLLHAASQEHDDEFKSAVKRIRERKEKERLEREASRTRD